LPFKCNLQRYTAEVQAAQDAAADAAKERDELQRGGALQVESS
jgi:hypothetical protein